MLPTKANPRPYNKKDYYVADPQCPPNTRQVPEGSMPLNEIFELFAKDQNAWLEEFVPAFEKMISNGYDDLVQGPNQFDGIVCNRGKRFAIEWEYTNCYHESVLNGPQYAIKNNYDGRALYMRDNGQLRVKNFDSDLPEQRWIFSGVGDQLINVKTGQPLVASQYGRSWKMDDKKRLINTRDETLALDRDASKGNNALVRMRPVSNAPGQKWTFVEI